MGTIPEPVKRQVRQEAGFGCCICGQPIFEYHHIVKDSQDPRDIMLLCPFPCHYKATRELISKEEQRYYRANPYNIEKGLVKGKLEIDQETPVVNLGNNQFITDGDFLLVDDQSLLSIEIDEGKIELTMNLYDQKDSLVAKIVRNEWISGDPLPWDLESKFQWLRIRRKLRDIELEIDARKYPINIRADLWRKGHNIQLSLEEIRIGGRKYSMIRDLCFVALKIAVNSQKQVIEVKGDPRFGYEQAIISHPNMEERIKKGLSAWDRITCNHNFVNIIDKKKYSVF